MRPGGGRQVYKACIQCLLQTVARELTEEQRKGKQHIITIEINYDGTRLAAVDNAPA